MPKIATETRIKPRSDIRQPPMFKVIYLNDDHTSIDFVISSLVQYFGYAEMTAEQLATTIHEQDSAVVAVLPFQLAEQKGIEVTVAARAQGYPLQIKIEPAN
jgi:ATP-dependent Clp protease adaptor protein ClpS